MRPTTDHGHEGSDKTSPPSTDEERRPDGAIYSPQEMEASFEEIER